MGEAIGGYYRLHIGGRKTGVSIHPDPKWGSMWRVHQGDRVSDMVNPLPIRLGGIERASAGPAEHTVRADRFLMRWTQAGEPAAPGLDLRSAGEGERLDHRA